MHAYPLMGILLNRASCYADKHLAMTDERGVIAAWLIKVVLGFAVFGLVLFDAGAIAWNYLGLDSAADDVVVALSTDLSDQDARNPQQLEKEAQSIADEARAQVVKVHVDHEGYLHVKLRRTAQTTLVRRFSFSKHWATTRSTAKISLYN